MSTESGEFHPKISLFHSATVLKPRQFVEKFPGSVTQCNATATHLKRFFCKL